MNRNTVMRCLRAAVIPAALVILNAPVSIAQQSAQASKPHWSVITVTSVKPGMQEEYEAAQKEVMAAFKKAGVPARHVLQCVMGDALEYVSAYPIANFADYEAHPFPAEQALGKEGWATLRAKLLRSAASIHRFANLQLEDDPRIQTGTKEPAPYAMVQFMRAVPGKAPELQAWLKDDYFPVMKKAEVKNMFMSRSIFGEGPNDYVLVRAIDKLGELDEGPLAVKVLGAEGARNLTAKTAGVVESVQFRIYRYRSDLSYQTPPNQATASAR
jgi:hypothetical protein